MKTLSSILVLTSLISAPSFPVEYQLVSEAHVSSRGVFLDQLFVGGSGNIPSVQVSPAPAFGRSQLLTKNQIREALNKADPTLVLTNFSGPDRIRILRKSRPFTESDLQELLTQTLNKEFVHDRGELEIHFARPWATVTVPDEVLSLKIMDLPSGGISPSFILRTEVYAGNELFGAWQIPIQARIWKEVYVTRSAVFRGQSPLEADLVRERRDVLTLRDAITGFPEQDGIEFAESVPPGQPLLVRHLKIRTAVKRGKVVEGLFRDGLMSISLKVEALEDGIPGQTIRVRNLQTRKEFRGKVQNEQTILLML